MLAKTEKLALIYAGRGGVHPLESVDWSNPDFVSTNGGRLYKALGSGMPKVASWPRPPTMTSTTCGSGSSGPANNP